MPWTSGSARTHATSAQYAQLPGVTGSVGTTIHESRNDASGPVLTTSPSNPPGQSDVDYRVDHEAEDDGAADNRAEALPRA